MKDFELTYKSSGIKVNFKWRDAIFRFVFFEALQLFGGEWYARVKVTTLLINRSGDNHL